MRLVIHENYQDASRWTAEYIYRKIEEHRSAQSRPFVLGLPTGSSPIGIYQALIRMYKAGTATFDDIVTFNMDEYVGLPADHPESYHFFMQDNFFSQVNVKPENIHILDGMAPDLLKECEQYEESIRAHGGIDLFLGGVGVDGHIAFNEPGSSLSSRTRIKTLTTNTRLTNARFFDGDIDAVPSQALTVGVGTIMDAHEVVIIVSGYNKAQALREAVEGSVSHLCTLSCLQMHRRAVIVCDDAATDELKVGTVRYFKDIEGDLWRG